MTQQKYKQFYTFKGGANTQKGRKTTVLLSFLQIGRDEYYHQIHRQQAQVVGFESYRPCFVWVYMNGAYFIFYSKMS